MILKKRPNYCTVKINPCNTSWERSPGLKYLISLENTIESKIQRIKFPNALLHKKIEQKVSEDKTTISVYCLIAKLLKKDWPTIIELFNLMVLASRFVYLLDYYYEKNEQKYYSEAQLVKNMLIKRLKKHNIPYSSDIYAKEKNIIKYYKYEQKIKTQIARGKKANLRQLKKLSWLRSCDTALYTKITKKLLNIKIKGLQKQIHADMLIHDLLDDIDDIREDLEHKNPNTLLSCLNESNNYNTFLLHKNYFELLRWAKNLIDTNSGPSNKLNQISRERLQMIGERLTLIK